MHDRPAFERMPATCMCTDIPAHPERAEIIPDLMGNFSPCILETAEIPLVISRIPVIGDRPWGIKCMAFISATKAEKKTIVAPTGIIAIIAPVTTEEKFSCGDRP